MSLRKRLTGLTALREGTSAPVPLASRLKAWRHGFSGWTWLLYDLDHNDRNLYVPDRLSGKMAAIDGPVARSVLKNKLLFEQVIGRLATVPRVLAAIDHGTLTRLRPEFEPDSVEALVDWVQSAPQGVFIKPVDSSEGRGAMSLESRAGELLVDKKPAQRADTLRRLADVNGCIVTALVQQGPFGRSVFPDAVNTLRVITMVDPENGEPFVASAIHRFGTAASAPTDNVSRRGLRCTVDPATGVLTAATASWAYENNAFLAFPQHPETGAQLEGATVPGWQDVVDTLLGIVRTLPMLLYVGWDAVVGEDGVVLIEGNHSPNIVQQAVGPYLADERIRRFLVARGVVPAG